MFLDVRLFKNNNYHIKADYTDEYIDTDYKTLIGDFLQRLMEQSDLIFMEEQGIGLQIYYRLYSCRSNRIYFIRWNEVTTCVLNNKTIILNGFEPDEEDIEFLNEYIFE